MRGDDNARELRSPNRGGARFGSAGACKAVPFVSLFGNRVNVSLSKWPGKTGVQIGLARAGLVGNGVHVPRTSRAFSTRWLARDRLKERWDPNSAMTCAWRRN
jgi:hypothetical protein